LRIAAHFTLVYPKNEKPIMLDNTCYFIGFNNLKNARIAHFLLNSNYAQQFLQSIIFPDSKRSITKQILMRIDFKKLCKLIDFNTVQNHLADITEKEWSSFKNLLSENSSTQQMTLF